MLGATKLSEDYFAVHKLDQEGTVALFHLISQPLCFQKKKQNNTVHVVERVMLHLASNKF